MSNSTVRLYDLLKAEYPNRVYVGQIPQLVSLQSTTGVILLESVTSSPTKNKDNAKRDQIVYYIHVIGSVLKTVDTLTEEIRNLVEPYTDEYIYLIEFDNTATDFNPEAETWERVLVFNVWPNTDGLNVPTGYYEYYAYMAYLTGAITVLNQNALNYMPITWAFENNTFTTTYTYNTNDIEFFWLIPNLQGDVMQFTNTAFEGTLTIVVPTQEVYQELQILIRVPKSATGSFYNPI